MSEKPLTDTTFSSFELQPTLLTGLESAGFLRCTPIQALTLPIALSGRDIAGQAQTGTGKTLAFLVVVMNRLLKQSALAERNPQDPRALILAPTRELAIQIYNDAQKLTAHTQLRIALIYGGVDYQKQRTHLQKGVDIIIATPGRLIDYVKQEQVVSLHACEMCVLDEADRMFDLGFIKDIRFLLRKMPAREIRQTLLFSATLSHRILELAYEHMNSPEKLVAETETITANRVRQMVYFPANDEKIPLLLGLLSRLENPRCMVFVNTKAWVEKVARRLEKQGYAVGILSGDVAQKKRESLLNKFQKGLLEILVVTDVAARGLHINGISHVFNFDLPTDAEDYVHRIGRTGRLGAEGDAISFACEIYAHYLPDIETYIEQKIPVMPITNDVLTALPRPLHKMVQAPTPTQKPPVSAANKKKRRPASKNNPSKHNDTKPSATATSSDSKNTRPPYKKPSRHPRAAASEQNVLRNEIPTPQVLAQEKTASTHASHNASSADNAARGFHENKSALNSAAPRVASASKPAASNTWLNRVVKKIKTLFK